jgi:hypothetical protein
LQASLSLWDGIPCFLDHDYTGQNSVRNLAGALHNPTWSEAAQGIQASLIPGGPGADDLQRLRLAAKSDQAIASAVGFSAHLFIQQTNNTVTKITKVNSVDCVMDPARGGRFLSANPQGANPMKKIIVRRNGVVMEINESEKLEGDEVIATLQTPTQPTQPINAENETNALIQTQAAQAAANSRNTTAEQALRLTRLKTCQSLLTVTLQAAALPAPSAERIRTRFAKMVDAGTPFEPSELDGAVAEEQTYLSAMMAAGTIQGPGRVNGMTTSADQLEAAVDNLFGVEHEARLANIKPARLTGIRELYLMLTGDYDLHGGYYGERIQLATTADFTGLVKNALNKVVSKSWDDIGAAGYDWWKDIVSVEHFTSLNDITGILIGTVGALPTVAESGEYTELAVGDSPETASFIKYGGYIPMSLELIDRDDARKLTAYAKELGKAAQRKLSALVAGIFTSNTAVGPTMADTGALFNATAVTTAGGHANLLTTAIGTDYTAWNALALAMYNQPLLVKQAAGYYGTGPKMAIWPRFCLVPGALRAAAEGIFVPRWASQLVAPNVGGPTWGGQVVVKTVPDWTDATDYAAVADPKVAPSIVIGERFGLKPEIFTAGRDTDPAVFMNDEHRIKVRMFTAVLVQDFRPLHKENVAG